MSWPARPSSAPPWSPAKTARTQEPAGRVDSKIFIYVGINLRANETFPLTPRQHNKYSRHSTQPNERDGRSRHTDDRHMHSLGEFWMATLQIDRRATSSMPASELDRTSSVQQALLIQARVGSISAVEYLKAHDVNSDVISRVLTSREVRMDDVVRGEADR